MNSYRVAWTIDLQAESPEDAARKARSIQRDPHSIATVFDVAPQCQCGEYHVDEAKEIDLMERTNAH